ncbi:hypothetical protein [Brucella cytisi]|uniref:Uncharacterized protein n=1 Tax=Brucella cytisi TaxID=407152 RepID=A0A1J6HR65_9HYPH|nr:hypothetical protein [Brucella cytisi]OIS90679.1 hypothetical protein BLA27_25445 [Brucella cytisi]
MIPYSPSTQRRLDDTVEAMRLLQPKVLAHERQVAHKKWYGYRFMTPLAATRYFATLYREGFKSYVRRHKDREEAERCHGLTPGIFQKPSGSLTQLWKARQRADELGLPYELLIEFGFEFASRRIWKHIPNPVQLFGSKNSSVAWPIEFEKFMKERMPLFAQRFSGLPQYRTENYRGFPVQDEFRAYLIGHIEKSERGWQQRLEGPTVRTRHLPLLIGLRLAPKDRRRRIIQDMKEDVRNSLIVPEPVEKLPLIAFAPACFGMPVAKKGVNTSNCASCPFAKKCDHFSDVAGVELLRRHPAECAERAEKRRQQLEGQRRRTANCRKRKEESLKMSAAA